MKIVPVQAENPSFKAKLVGTQEFRNYYSAICDAKYLPYNDCFNGLRRLRAIESHPANAEIKLYTERTSANPNVIFGVIESQYAKYTDPEPVNKDNSLIAISNILKRIFLQENTDKFGKLLGEKDISSLEEWKNEFFRVHPLTKVRKPVTPNEMEKSYANWFSMQDGSLK